MSKQKEQQQELSAVWAYVHETAWYLEPKTARRMIEVLARRNAGVKLTGDEIAVAVGGDRKQPDYTEEFVVDGVAVIPVNGLISKYSCTVCRASTGRGSSTIEIQEYLDKALGSDDVRSILLYVDSPGGSVSGIDDLARNILAARAEKPVLAFIEDMGASGAYYLASQAQTVYSNAAAAVGSIGVYTYLDDWSERYATEGVKTHIVKHGKWKGIGLIGTKVTEEQLEILSDEIRGYYELFVDAVAAGREMPREQVMELANGRFWLGNGARKRGLVDKIVTFKEALIAAVAAGQERFSQGSNTKGTGTMSEEKTKSAEEIAAAEAAKPPAAAVVDTEAAEAKGRALGAEAERERISGIQDALGADFADQAAKATADGLTVEAGKALAFDEACRQRDGAKENWTKMCKALEGQGIDSEKFVNLQASDEESEAQAQAKAEDDVDADGKPKTYGAMVKQLMAGDDGVADHRARIEASKTFPEGHEAWLKEQDKERRQKK